MSETKQGKNEQVKIEGAANAALENAADAQAAQATAVAGAAQADAQQKEAVAAQVTVAAAEGAAALAAVESAKAQQNAAEVVNQTTGELSWLKTNQELMENSLKELRQETQAVKEIPAIVSMLGKMSAALERLTPQPLPETPPGTETQIVDPATLNPKKDGATGGTKAAAAGSQKSSPSRTSKQRIWTTGRKV